MAGSRVRLGEPIELPWWVVPLTAIPLLVVLAGVLLPQPWSARLLAVPPGLLLVAAVLLAARRVRSTSMQAVWISAAYGVWVLFPVAWVVLSLRG